MESVQCSDLKKNMKVMIQGRPCMIVTDPFAGGEEIRITAMDVFTRKVYKETYPLSQKMEVFSIKCKKWELMDRTGEGFAVLMDNAGNMRQDLKAPGGQDINEFISEENCQNLITVLSVGDEEQIIEPMWGMQLNMN